MTATNLAKHKYLALDSLRGIAAVMVIFQHFWEINHPSDARLKPWLFFCAGHEAVILFFVLSGFVLSHQLRNFRLNNYGEFVMRRILRIYPAYYAALLFSAVLLYFFQHYYPSSLDGHGLTRWFYIWSSTVFDKPLIINSVLLITHNGSSLNVAIWSLYFEMWISLLFPFVMLGLWRSGLVIRILLAAVLLYISWQFFKTGNWIDDQWQAISYYLWYFIVGSVLYFSHDKLKFISGYLSLVIGIGLYFINYLVFGNITSRLEHEMILAIGCFLILLNGIHLHSFRGFLQRSLFQFYGKISYSLYLFHLPVLYGLSYWLLRDYNLSLVKVATFVVATLLAWASYVSIELGGIRLAKNILKY